MLSKNIRICHEFVEPIDKSVSRDTVWYHEALPSFCLELCQVISTIVTNETVHVSFEMKVVSELSPLIMLLVYEAHGEKPAFSILQ